MSKTNIENKLFTGSFNPPTFGIFGSSFGSVGFEKKDSFLDNWASKLTAPISSKIELSKPNVLETNRWKVQPYEPIKGIEIHESFKLDRYNNKYDDHLSFKSNDLNLHIDNPLYSKAKNRWP